VHAATRRGNPDEVIAKACAEGRFSAERAPFWRAELDRDPAGTMRLLTEPPERGGLAPVAIAASAGPPELTQAQEDEALRLHMTTHFKGPSRKLTSDRWSVGSPPAVTRINDRS
jgi:hypothetical protein